LDEFVWQIYLLHCLFSSLLADELSKLGAKLLEVNCELTQLLIAATFFGVSFVYYTSTLFGCFIVSGVAGQGGQRSGLPTIDQSDLSNS